MQKVTLGKTGLEVSRLGFGGGPIGFLDTKHAQVCKVLTALIEEGVNLIDTAACYDGSERAIGKAIVGRRDELVLVSKCGHVAGDLKGAAWSPELIEASVDQSLRRLGTDRIDVMLLHSCDRHILETGEALEALCRAKEAGKVLHVGYSGDNEAAAYAADLDEIEVIETSINIVDQANIDMVLPTCRRRNLGVIAKRPLANACWKQLEYQPGVYKEYAATYTQRLNEMKLTPMGLGFMGLHPEVEWPEIALRFVLSQEGVHTAVTGTTSSVNAHANVEAIKNGPLSDDIVARIREAFLETQKASGAPWTAQV